MNRVRVGDVVKLERRHVEVDPFESYSLIGVYSFGKGIFHREPKLGSELGNYRFFAVEPGDLVLSNIQAWEGAIAYATESDRGCIGTHRFLTYVPADGEVDMDYLHHYFLSETGHALIQQAAPGSVTRNRTLAIDRFENLEIPLPSLDEQLEIVREVEQAHALTREIDQRTARAKALIEAIRAASARSRASQVPLGDVLDQVARAEPVDPSREYKLLGVRSFGLGSFDAGTINGAETRYRALHRVTAGDFVFPKLMAWEGAFAVVPDRFDGYFVSPEFCTFTAVGERLRVGYLGALFRAPATWASIAGSSIGTNVRRRRLYPKDFLAREIPLPEIAEQERIAALAHRVDEVDRLNSRRLDLAEALRVSALNHAFSAAA